MGRMGKELRLSEITLREGEHGSYAIYGAGEIGRMLGNVLRLFGEARLECFLCSAGYKQDDAIGGTPVYDMDEYLADERLKGSGATILLTTQRGGEEIYARLREKGLPVRRVNSKKDVLDTYAFFYRDYFEGKGVALDGEEIALGGVSFPNPFREKPEYALSFFMECGDLILPEVFCDLRYIHEGPYEVGGCEVEEGDVVVDCGSNIGLFSAIVAGRASKVYAFEPMPEVGKYVEGMAKRQPGIELCRYALSSYCGKSMFTMDGGSNATNRLVTPEGGRADAETAEVDVITLDDFVEKRGIGRVDYIKADIEGSEREMLRGAAGVLRKFAPKLSICEYHLPDDPEVLERIILEANPDYVVRHENMKLHAYVEKAGK